MVSKHNLVQRFLHFWRTLGPGLITGASNDDPSAMITIIQAGAAFGMQLFWLPIITIPLLSAILEICGRIGMVTSQGLTGILRLHYPRVILWLLVGISIPALLLNMAADIAAIGSVAHLIFPGIHAAFFSLIFIVVFMFIMLSYSYQRFTSLLKYFSLVLLVYTLVPFFERPNWQMIWKSITFRGFHMDSHYLLILVALLGANISPYMFFWQTSMVEGDTSIEPKKPVRGMRAFQKMHRDVSAGTIFSNLIVVFILFTASTVFYNAGILQIDTLDMAAQSLKPLAGKGVYVLFAMGVIGTGAVIIPVLSSSISFILMEAFNLKEGFNKKFHEARSFYTVIGISLLGGLIMNFTSLNPVKALLGVTTLYGLMLPFVIGLILHISNNSTVMGLHVNRRTSNIQGLILLLLTGLASFGLLWLQLIG